VGDAVVSSTGRILVGGTTGANGYLARLIGTVERPTVLAVSGGSDGTARTFVPNAAHDGYLPAPTNQTIANPFGAAVTVRTATGDFNADGFEDTVLVTGPGLKAAMAVVSGKDNSVLLAPADPVGDANFTAGLFVTAGDIDGDGRSEWAVTPELTGGPRVIVFRLNPTGGGAQLVANFFGIQDERFRDGARAAFGDVNGDGVQDVYCIAAFNGGPRTAVFDGRDVLAHIAAGRQPNKLTNDFFANTTATDTGRGGQYIAAGDVNGDGRADLITTGDNLLGTGNHLFIFSGADLAAGKFPGGSGAQAAAVLGNFTVGGFPAGSTTSLTAKDLDGDARADVVAGAGTGGSSVKAYRGANITAGGGEPTAFALDPGIGGATFGVFVG
jgi:hypothetical protein